MAITETTAIHGAAAAGITIFGVATGVDPSLLLGGIAGGWWALIQFEVQATLLYRIGFVALSALLGAWGGSILGAVGLWAAQKIGLPLPELAVNIVAALVVGLLGIKWLGPRLVKLSDKAADAAEKQL